MKKILFGIFFLLATIIAESHYLSNRFLICAEDRGAVPLLPEQKEPMKPLDVSGQWTLHFKGVEYGCQNPQEDGQKEGTFVFNITQQGENLSATFADRRTTNHLKGVIRGTTVTATVHGLYPDNCRVVTEILGEVVGKDTKGEVVGKEIKGTYSGKELNCETCIWEGEFTVEIAH